MKKINISINTKLIDEFLEENKLTKAEFCKKYNFSTSSLKNIYTSNPNIGLNTVLHMARILGVELHQMFHSHEYSLTI